MKPIGGPNAHLAIPGSRLTPECIHCGTRRLPCDRRARSCSSCDKLGLRNCSYDWTLAPHIYNLFLPHMNLNGELRIDLQRVAHSTRTARVYKTEWSGNGLVAVKVLVENALPDRILQLTVRECWTWAQLQHENIVPLWGIADLQKIAVSGGFTQLCMVSPWMEQGNIMEFLKENPTANRLRLLWDIVKGVEYLHSLKPNKIVHGDLKGNNVLVDISDGGPRARLTDFGLSYAIQELNDQIPSSSTSTSYRGNPRWMAFERVLPKKFGAKNAQDAHTTRSDVFELMRTFLEVLTGLAPFHTVSDYEITQVVVAGKNPERPQSTQDLDEYMWRLMGRSWDHDRNKRPPLSEIWDIMECAVLRDAFLHDDTEYLCAADVSYTISRLTASEASDSTRILLLRRLEVVVMNGSAEKVHNHTEFSTLVHLIVRSLGRGGHHVPKPITPLYQEAFAVLASLKRDASEDTIRIMSTIVRAELPLASLVHILVIGEEVHIADFEEILCLALHDFDETPGEAKFESMDEALLYMSDAIVRGAITPALTPYWTALLTRKPVQKRILTRLHSEGEFSVSWAIMFYNVAEWLRSCGSQECLSLLDGMVSQIKMSVFLDDASTDDVINATLRLATLVAKQPNPQNPIDRPLILKILPLFCRELERTSDFDLPATCLRLLRTSHFSETLADLMQSASSLDYSTLLYLARTLKVASLRLNSNPFDTLFALLHQLPWTSVISAHLAPTHEGVQLEVMESLAAGRILFRTTSDQDHAVSVLPRELSQQEAEIALPLVARILSTSHDQVQASLCIKFFAFVGFKAVFQTAFATNCATDMVFNAASRIWAWCYAPSHAGSPWQAEGAKLISEKLPLDQQIRYIMSIADNTPESARLFPLLRLLALRINGHRKEKAISTVMPILLSCACKFIGCSWVASEDDIVDIVRNEDVLAGAFRVLSLRNNQATAEVRSDAIRCLATAYRLTGGRAGNIQSFMSNVEIRTMELIYDELVKIPNYSLAYFWEFLYYRVQQEKMSNTSSVLMPRLIPLALAQISALDDRASFIALLMVQYLYRRYDNSAAVFAKDLPSDMAISLPSWIKAHSAEIAKFPPNMDLLDEFRRFRQAVRTGNGGFHLQELVNAPTRIVSRTSDGRGSLSPTSVELQPSVSSVPSSNSGPSLVERTSRWRFRTSRP